MWKIFKRYGCQPTPITKPIRLRRRDRNVAARAAINIGNPTEETVIVNENNPVAVEEIEPAENTEKLAEEADEATKQECSASDIEKCPIEKVDVVTKGEPAKDFKICTNKRTKKYLRCHRCGKYQYIIPVLLNKFTGATRAPGGG